MRGARAEPTEREEPGVTAGGRPVDDRVVEACRRGDPEAQRAVFEAYKDRVYSTALYFFNGDAATARDVTQSVFLGALRGMAAFRAESGLSTWLHRLTINACVDEHRRRRRWVPMEDVEPAGEPSEDRPQEERYERMERLRQIREAVATLGPKVRAAVLLRYVSGLSYAEVASALGCSPGTVASRLNAGHRILARRLAHLRPAPAREG
jgi:RNA polymerase sigma-70 factor (ECF subfamily)